MDRSANQPYLTAIAAAAIVVASLHFAQPVLMPLVVAMLLSVVFTPAVKRLERIGLGRVVSVVLVCALATGGLFAIGWVVVGQVTEIVSLLPEYRQNVRGKVQAMQESLGSFERAAQHLQELENELADATGPSDGENAPQVQVVERDPEIIDVLSTYLGTIAAPLATAGLVIVMLIFILIQREDLRDRVLRVVGSRDLWLTTAAIDDASARVTRYLRAYTLLNFGHGVVVALGLWLLGLPAALLFGLIAFTLRFIPYVGPWIAAVLPVMLSIAVFDSWSATLAVVAYLAAVELVSNNVFEPWFYGSSVGLSPFAVIVAAVFWAWVWGAVGLVVAIPITVCVVVIGRHVPQLRFLAVLLGDEPALAPPIRLYQRLLARDVDEAEDLVEAECKVSGVEPAMDSLLLPALTLVDYERRLGRLDEEELDAVHQTFGALTTALADCAFEGDGGSPATPLGESGPFVLCLPAGAFGDEIACEMLVRVLARSGIRARTTPRLLTGEMVERALEEQPDIVLISALPPTGGRVVRYLCRRLIASSPDLDVLVGLWGADEEVEDVRKLFAGQCVRVVTKLADAARLLRERTSLCPPKAEWADEAEPIEEPAQAAESARVAATRGLDDGAEHLLRRAQERDAPAKPDRKDAAV